MSAASGGMPQPTIELAGAARSTTTWPHARQAVCSWLSWTELDLQRGQVTRRRRSVRHRPRTGASRCGGWRVPRPIHGQDERLARRSLGPARSCRSVGQPASCTCVPAVREGAGVATAAASERVRPCRLIDAPAVGVRKGDGDDREEIARGGTGTLQSVGHGLQCNTNRNSALFTQKLALAGGPGKAGTNPGLPG